MAKQRPDAPKGAAIETPPDTTSAPDAGRPATSPDVPAGEGSPPPAIDAGDGVATVPPAVVLPMVLEGGERAEAAALAVVAAVERLTAAVDAVTVAPAAPEPPAPPPPRPVWRRAALCLRATTLYFGGTLVKVLGGEWIEERERLAVVARDPAFHVFELESPEHLVALRAGYERELADLRARAATLGYVLYREGEIDPARRR